MAKMKLIYWITILLISKFVYLLAEECSEGFSVVMPEVGVPGKPTAVLVTLHGTTKPVNVTLRLLADQAEELDRQVTLITQEITGHGIVPMQIPAESEPGSYVLQTLVDCPGADLSPGTDPACGLHASSQLRLLAPVRDVIIRPASHAYRPGQSISFWVLAVDHELQIAPEITGSVSVRDPAGTKVAIWDQVPLSEGVKSFSLPLSERATLGMWKLQVEVDNNDFSTEVEVSAIGADYYPDIAAAEEHYVELRFGREMRRSYKPGLPFIGKVEAMSTEKSVRVRVKVYDNTTSIYSQDIEINNGEGTFIVPAILADSDVIALQAELVSVEGKEIESHYVLAREPIHKWNSTSDCYLLIEGVEHTLQPDEEAHVTILSTCPCERDLHYVITTDGRVTDWAQRRYEDDIPISNSQNQQDGAAICKLNFSFQVRSIMAPVSQLLVYYVTTQGEPVSDVISFDVKLLQKQVYVNIEEREFWYPEQTLDLEVVAEQSSLVCLIGGRSGNGNDVRFDPRVSDDRKSVVTGEMDFLEAGVSFFQRQCIKRGDSDVYAVSYRQRGSGAGPGSRRRPQESLVGGEPFDKIWLWNCFNYTSEVASTGISVEAPEEAGKWAIWALTMGSTGLRFSHPVSITVFRPLQADFHLPPSLRVGETLEVDVKIANNINTCMDVTALLALSEGAQFVTNGLLYVTERLRLGPHGATSLVVRILMSTPGLKNMTVEVNGYSSSTCDVIGSSAANNESLAGAVVRSVTVLVHPEGLVKTDTESAYFCANENMVISTNENFRYDWVPTPRNRAALVFELKASSSAHMALSDTRHPNERMYQVVIGDSANSMSWLGRGKHGYGIQLVSERTPEILSADRWKTFWVSWEKNTLLFGEGYVINNNTLLKWKMDKNVHIQHIGFSSAWGTSAQFRIWNYNDEAGFSQVLHLDVPRSGVPGSESGVLKISGGLSLPNSQHLSHQTSSLQSSIASLTPLLLLDYLGNKANESFRNNIVGNLPGQIQTILSFRNADNSFSEHHMLSSHSATIYVLEVLVRTQGFFNIDPYLIQEMKRWIQLRQEDNGSFTPLPADVKINDESYSKFMNQTAKFTYFEHSVELTAETLITLNELLIENDSDLETVTKAKKFLEDSVGKVRTSTAISSVALALTLVNSQKAPLAVEFMKNVSTTEEGDFGWPHILPKRDAADWLYETESGHTLKEPIITTVEDFKASVNALATFCLIKDLKSAENVVRYLFYRSHMLDKHPELIFPAVKAFGLFSILANDEHRSLTVSLATSGMELTDTLELRGDHMEENLHLPSLPTKVFIYATGAGCATIQGMTTYSTYAAVSETLLLDLQSRVLEEITTDRSSVDEIEGKLPMLKVKTCFRWKSEAPSGVLRLEVSLFSGYELFSITPLPELPEDMQHGSQANNLWFVFANVTSNCPICVQYLIRNSYVISSLRPAYARIYPAMREDLAAEIFFHMRSNSVLTSGITEDDFITWFGKNDTSSQSYLENYMGCQKSATKSSTTTMESEVSTTTSPRGFSQKVNLSKKNSTLKSSGKIAGVQNKTIVTLKSKNLLNITVIPPKKVIVKNITSPGKPPKKLKLFAITPEDKSKFKTAASKSPEDKGKLKAATSKPVLTTIPSTTVTKVETSTTTGTSTQILQTKTTQADPITTPTTEIPQTTTPRFTTPLPMMTKFPETTANIHHEKHQHINTELHQIPPNLETLSPEVTTEEPDFLNKDANKKFVILDKNELWGMLKEVVKNEFESRKSEEEAKKLRLHGT